MTGGSVQRYPDVRVDEVETVLDDLRGYARNYGGKVSVIKRESSKFLGAEAILPRSIGDEYIPSTNAEKMDTLPHVTNMHQFSGLYYRKDGLSRFTLKESYAADLLDPESNDEGEQEIPRQTLNIFAFYRFVWGPEGVIQAMIRGAYSVDTRPYGSQKYVVRTLDVDTGELTSTTLRRMEAAENLPGPNEPFMTIERDPDLIDLRKSMAQYAEALTIHDANERALFNSDDIDAKFQEMLARINRQ